MSGFLVWNTSRRLPTYAHPTLAIALSEAERLTRLNPGEEFMVMAPVLTEADAARAKAWSDGKAWAERDAHRQIMHAEARTDRLLDEKHDMEVRHLRFLPIERSARAFQTIVADALLWFDGFAAAFAQREGWERPRIPDREQLRELNRVLLDLEKAAQDEEIPF